MQAQELESIQTAGAINADVAALQDQIKSGEIKLGPIRNIANTARNRLGYSDQESQNFSNLKTTLEKLRNDSLRLNAGVQTEGDAIRAWNELMDGIADPGVVQTQLARIQNINDRAIKLRKMNIDAIRLNYGHEPMNVDEYIKQPSAIPNTQKGDGAWKVVR